MLGDLWRWGLHSPEMHRDMDKAWRQLIRWLIADVPQRLDLQVESSHDEADAAVRLQLRVRDPSSSPSTTPRQSPGAARPRSRPQHECGSPDR